MGAKRRGGLIWPLWRMGVMGRIGVTVELQGYGVRTEGLIEAGKHWFIVAPVCEVESFSPPVFSCLGTGMEKADSWTDSRLGCCQSDATNQETEAIGKRVKSKGP
jgi:hypothetical protein